jgi:hypothetical protein
MTTATTKNKEALARHSSNDWLLLVVFLNSPFGSCSERLLILLRLRF